MDSPEIFEIIPDPIEEFHSRIEVFLKCISELNTYWESQRLECNETHLPSPLRDSLTKIRLSIEELVGKNQNQEPYGITAVPSNQITSVSDGADTRNHIQVIY